MLAIAIANAQDDKAAFRIVVSIPDRKLALLEGEPILKFMMSPPANRDAEPPGEFKIVSRAINPV